VFFNIEQNTMLTLRSPAKINLFLRILGKRPDGYHELASLFQAISLFDFLSFDFADHDAFACSLPQLPVDESNLVVKAVRLFRSKTGLTAPLKIHLDKHIPMEAGLGGGSGNAATVLWGLNELFGKPVSASQLASWGGDIGSDVAFFLSQGTAYCTGRGEIVENLAPLQSEPVWIIKPAFGLSTANVYKSLTGDTLSTESPSSLLQGFQQGNGRCVNDLEVPAFQLSPALKEIKHVLSSRNEKVALSGSGTSFFWVGRLQPPTLDNCGCHLSAFVNRPSDAWY
jgi:4-diphosphocytidyl-2-C-methyl-D-erythritol kinase